jgi:hypothetical protein
LKSDDPKKCSDILENPLIDDLLSILKHYKTDPVLLTALCKFAKAFFSCEEIKTNRSVLEEKVTKTQNFIQLVPYLGLKKYEEVLKMARFYHANPSDSDKVVQF